MKELSFTLLSDGSSDRALLPVLSWLLIQSLTDTEIQSQWADLRGVPNPPRRLPDRIKKTLDLYSCDLLFVHRDAENVPLEQRVREIHQALDQVRNELNAIPPVVCVVPVRMQEAWLLFDEMAIRTAVRNPHGRNRLVLPPLKDLERMRDPKTRLYDLLREATNLPTNRLKRFRPSEIAFRVGEFVQDFSPLRQLHAFRILERDVQQIIEERGWKAE